MERRTNKFVAAGATGLLSSASFFDAFIHTFPSHRFILGKTVGNHIGNTIYSAAPVILATCAGDIIAQEGIRRRNKLIEVCGNALPLIAMGVMALANFQVEHFPGNFQFAGDMTDGLLTIPLAFAATRMAINLYRSASIQRQIMADDRLLM